MKRKTTKVIYDIDIMSLVQRLEHYLDKKRIFDLTDKFDTVFNNNGKPMTSLDQFTKFISNKELGYSPSEIKAFGEEYLLHHVHDVDEEMVDLKALLDDIMDCEELNDEKFEVEEGLRRSVASSIKHAFAEKFAKIKL